MEILCDKIPDNEFDRLCIIKDTTISFFSHNSTRDNNNLLESILNELPTKTELPSND